MDLGCTLGVDADPVRHGRHRSEGPAGSAVSLVSNLLQTGTVRPLGPVVKTGGNVLGVSQHFSLGQTIFGQIGVGVDSSSDSTEIVETDLRVETGEDIQ